MTLTLSSRASFVYSDYSRRQKTTTSQNGDKKGKKGVTFQAQYTKWRKFTIPKIPIHNQTILAKCIYKTVMFTCPSAKIDIIPGPKRHRC